MPKAKLNGIEIHYQVLGSQGAKVVFLHGLLLDNMSSWYMTLANPVGQENTAILYDLRGHGLSERPADGYDVESQISDLNALLDFLGVEEPVYFVGSSFGGILALYMAVHHPERVAGVILIEAHVAVEGWSDRMVGGLEFAGKFVDHPLVNQWLSENSDRKFRKLAATARSILEDTSLVKDMSVPIEFTEEQLSAIKAPTLSIYGENSDVLEWAEDLSDLLPKSEFHVFEGCTHSVMTEATFDVRKTLLDWLGRAERNELADSASRLGPAKRRRTEGTWMPTRPLWYPANAPWPPVAGEMPEDWDEDWTKWAATEVEKAREESARAVSDPESPNPAGDTEGID